MQIISKDDIIKSIILGAGRICKMIVNKSDKSERKRTLIFNKDKKIMPQISRTKPKENPVEQKYSSANNVKKSGEEEKKNE